MSPQDGSNTVPVVHYASLSSLVDILKAAQPRDNPGNRGSATSANSDDGTNAQSNSNVSYLRMYSSGESNDPNEGRYLFEHCASKVPTTGESLTTYLLDEPATESQTARPKPPCAYLFLPNHVRHTARDTVRDELSQGISGRYNCPQKTEFVTPATQRRNTHYSARGYAQYPRPSRAGRSRQSSAPKGAAYRLCDATSLP